MFSFDLVYALFIFLVYAGVFGFALWALYQIVVGIRKANRTLEEIRDRLAC